MAGRNIGGFFGAVGDVIGPLTIGLLSDHLGIVTAFYAMAIAAVVATIPAVFYRRLKRIGDTSS